MNDHQASGASHPPQVTRAKKLAFTGILLGIEGLLVAAVIYSFFYRPRLKELRETRRPDTERLETHGVVSSSLVKLVGHIGTDQRSSFSNFPAAKPAGVYGLCAFGDSYTKGSETGPSHDYPTLLQEILDQRSAQPTEVLNFGNDWHGFHQAYLLWERLAGIYESDRILLGPRCFQPKRDTRFNHTDLVSPYFLHARYVLDDGDVRLVEVIGDTHEERFESYFRFIPHLRYLRYDRAAPFVLQSLLRRGRVLGNPFYYFRGGEEAEAFETYRILLSRILQLDARIILGHYFPSIVELARGLDDERLVEAKLYRPRSFPYVAPRGHNSSWGNQLVAEQFASLALGETTSRLRILKAARRPGRRKRVPGVRAPLHRSRNIFVEIGDTLAGVFVVAAPGHDRGRGQGGVFSGTKTTALLCLKTRVKSPVDSCFVPLQHQPPPEAKLVLRLEGQQQHQEYELGVAREIDSRLNLFIANLKGIRFPDQEVLRLKTDGLPPAYWQANGGARLTVLLGSKPVLQAEPHGNVLDLRPLTGHLYRLRVPEGAYIDPSRLPKRGVFRIALYNDEGDVLRIPIAGWRRVNRTVRLLEDTARQRRHPAPRRLRARWTGPSPPLIGCFPELRRIEPN